VGLIEIAIIAAMLLLNSLFAAYELALASVSLGRLRLLVDRKKMGAAAALAMKNRMEASFAVVQIGITLVGAIAAATGGSGAEKRIAPRLELVFGLSSGWAEVLAIALVVLPLSAVTIMLGELVPKSLAIRNSEWFCLRLSPFMRAFALVVYPAVVAFEQSTRFFVRWFERGLPEEAGPSYELGLAELRAQAHALRAKRVIGLDQERIIMGASALTKTRVSDILVPAEDIVMLYADGPLTEHLVTVHLDGYTRFPVTEMRGDVQGIIGYLNLKELLLVAKTHPADPSIRQIVRPLVEVSPASTISQAFGRMMSEHVHLALVRDEEGTVRGMITLEDILEEIVGDIQDEFDRFPKTVVHAGQHWIVGGGATLGQLRRAMRRPEWAAGVPETTALADWLTTQVANELKGGDALVIEGTKILVRKMRRKKVFEALMTADEK
jgi:putative hemolysin